MSDYPLSVSITGDGKPSTFKVTTQDGTELKGITAIHFDVSIDQMATATIDLYAPSISLSAVQAQVPFDQLEQVARAHGFLLIPEMNAAQLKLSFPSLQSYVRGHGYELIKTDGPDGFYEEP